MMLSDVCQSVCRVHWAENREAYRKTKIGTEIAHVTRDSDTTFKVKMSKIKVTGAGDIVAASRLQFVIICRHICLHLM